MISILTLLPIFGFSALLTIYLKKRVSSSIFFAITFIITIIFIFGMFDFLKFGSLLLFYGGILLLIYFILRYKKEMLSMVTSVPFIIFTISSILYLFFMKDAHFFFWDEYSHWGPFIKELYFFDSFYDASSQITHLRYPPGISIWDYFIVSNLFYSEGNIYFAYFLILFSSTLMMYERLNWKHFYWIILVFVIQMVIFATYGHWFSCIYVDHIIGALFTGLILSYLVDRYSNMELLLFIFPLVSLVLVKEVGLFFALAFVGLIWLLQFDTLRKQDNISFIRTFISLKKLTFVLIIIFLSSFIALKSWNIRQDSLGVGKEKQTISGIVTAMVSDKKVLDNKTEIEVKERFWEVVAFQQLHKEKISLNYNEFSYGIMSKYKNHLKLSTLGSFLFFIFLSLMVYFLISEKTQKHRVVLISSYLLTISVGYLLILYMSYLIAFGNDALRIPSFVRYMNIAMLPLFFIAFTFFLPLFYKFKKDSLKIYLSFFLLIVLFIIFTKPYIQPLYSQLSNGFRVNIDKRTQEIVEVVPKGAKLLVIFPIKNNGSLNNILKYNLMPIRATISENNLEKKKLEEILKIYSKYEYIWFASLNQETVNRNNALLKQKNDNNIYLLYKVQIINNTISFKPIK